MGDLYKDAALPYLLCLVFSLKCVVSLENYLEPRVLLLVSEKCLTVAFVTIFLYFKKEDEKIIQKGGGFVNRKHLEACSVEHCVYIF